MRQLDNAGVVAESAEFAEADEGAEFAKIDCPWEESQEYNSLTVKEEKRLDAMVRFVTEKFQS